MTYYAQIDLATMICTVVSDFGDAGFDPLPANLIKLGDVNEPSSFLGKKFQAGQWSVVPPPDPVIPTTYNISKADIYRRCTDEEVEALHAALSAAPIRLQGIFSGATMINTGDDYYPALRAGIVAALGETRADEVLAPSNI